MPRENIELMRRATDAFNRGEPEGYLAALAPRFGYMSSGIVSGGAGVCRGPFFQVWAVRDGKITRGQGFPDWERTLEAAGSED